MADLTGTTPANTYKGLLQVNDYTDGIAGNTGSNALVIQDGAGNATALAISTDNVGIGTTSPDAKLVVKGTQTEEAQITISADNTVGEKDAILFLNATRGTGNSGANASIRATHDGSSGLGKMLLATRRAPGTGEPTTAMAIDSDGNVGIGTTSPAAKFHINGGAANNQAIFESTDGTSSVLFKDPSGTAEFGNKGDDAVIMPAGVEKMRITSAGNVGIGTTSPDAPLHVLTSNTTDTLLLESTGDSALNAPDLVLYRNSATPADSDNLGIIKFRGVNDGTVGVDRSDIDYALIQSEIEDASNNAEKGSLSFWTRGVGSVDRRMTIDSAGNVTPGTDDAQDFGSASLRWDDIYATNTTIQSSDRELKQDIEELSEAETRVAQACKGLLRKYRWKSSVEEKGDEARIHFGIIAQDLEAAFAAEGLDAGRYGMFVKNTWWTADRVIPAVEAMEAVEAVYDEEGNEVSPAVEAVEAQPEKTVTDIFNNSEDAPEGATEVTQRGVRYSELLAFIIAAI